MDSLLTPLSISVPIVDPKTGNPTPYFQRVLQQLLKEKAITDELAEGAVQASRQIISGGGLTGGGNLSADRTLAVGAGTGITVNADDVALDLTYVDERIRDIMGVALIAGSNVTITVDDAANTITIASSGGGGGGGGMALLAEQTLGANAASVDFTGISQSYRNLRLISEVRRDVAGEGEFFARFNNDSSAIYNWAVENRFGTGFQANDTRLRIGAMNPSTYTAGVYSINDALISNYSDTTRFKNVHGRASYNNPSAIGFDDRLYGSWRSNSAINRITLLPVANNFATGSRFRLYGLS